MQKISTPSVHKDCPCAYHLCNKPRWRWRRRTTPSTCGHWGSTDKDLNLGRAQFLHEDINRYRNVMFKDYQTRFAPYTWMLGLGRWRFQTLGRAQILTRGLVDGHRLKKEPDRTWAGIDNAPKHGSLQNTQDMLQSRDAISVQTKHT